MKLIEFATQVKQEASRITWSSRKEVVYSTIMVLVFVSILALFFLAVDSAILRIVRWVLGL